MKKTLLSLLLAFCLTAAAGAAMPDEDFAGLCEKASCVEILPELLKGANPNATTDFGRTVLIRTAWKNPNPQAVSLLLKAGADVNARDKDG